jgi:ribonuclease HI
MAEAQSFGSEQEPHGHWRFLLRQIDGPEFLEVSDREPGLLGERLQLFATIRGLEAIGQPARVTLVTSSQYVTRGIRRDLNVWREMNWTWERFGELHPIKHQDLWRRLDHAMQYHHVQCRSLRFITGDEGDRPGSRKCRGKQPPRSAQKGRDRLGKYRKQFVDGWVRMAQRMNSRNTIESWAMTH